MRAGIPGMSSYPPPPGQGAVRQFDKGCPGKMSNFGTSYDWAIVSGTGEVPSNGKCVSGLGYFNFKGFWLFSRLPTPPAGIAEKIEAVASAKGLDTSVLRPMVQEGCTYEK